MSDTGTQTFKRKHFLFVDDDGEFLAGIRDFFGALSQGRWEIHLAQNHAQAFALLQKQKMDLIGRNIILCADLLKRPELLKDIGVRSESDQQKVMTEAKEIIGTK